MYTVDQIIETFSFSNPEIVSILIAFCIANAIGFLEYIWAVRINIREHRTPFPAWMHTFFFAHDFTCACVMFWLAFTHDFFWLFLVYGGGMLIWTVLELTNMRTVALYEHDELLGAGSTVKDAVVYLVLQVAVMFAFVNVMRYLMNDVAMFFWLPMTNFVMAVGPGYVLNKRKSREGSSVFIYIMVVCGTAFNFAPAGIGLFSSVLPEVFNQPMWFAVGAVCLVIAIYNLVRIIKLPAKEQVPGEKKPIW